MNGGLWERMKREGLLLCASERYHNHREALVNIGSLSPLKVFVPTRIHTHPFMHVRGKPSTLLGQTSPRKLQICLLSKRSLPRLSRERLAEIVSHWKMGG